MRVNSKQFFKELDQFEDELRRSAEAAVRKTVKKLYNNIVTRTPVDTGYAKSNWKFTLGSARGNLLPRPSRKFYGPPSQMFLTSIPFGSIITIYNNTPYIKYLENGHSRQAPSGMVALSMVEAEAMLQSEFRKL